MTTMSSMKFRTENDMSLSSTTQGLENHENPLGSPKAEDGSSRPRCRGPQGHRLKPAKTRPASKAVLFGPPSITKCMYLLMICTFSALMVSMYGGKGKISQHRRLTKYDKYEDFDTLKRKLDGTDKGADIKNKQIAGYSLDKPEMVANEFYKKVRKWKDNAEELNAQAPRIHEQCEKGEMKGHEDYNNKYNRFEDFQKAVNPYLFASESLKNCIEKARTVKHKNDFQLMKSILAAWFATPIKKLGESREVQNKTIEIVEKLLMRQLQSRWLQPKTVADVAEIVEAINITKERTSRCIQFLTKIWRMPLPKWSELLAKGVEEKHGSIYKAYEQYEIFCDRVVHMQSFIKVQLFGGPVSLYGYESEHEFQLVDRYIGMRQNPILSLELYARRTSNPKRSECPMPYQDMNDFLRTTDGQNLVAAWVCALKDLAHDEIEWIKALNPTDVQFWTIDLKTSDSDEDLPDQIKDLRRLKRIREVHCRSHRMGSFGLPSAKTARTSQTAGSVETAPAPSQGDDGLPTPSQGLGAPRQGGGLPPPRRHGLPAPRAQEAES